MPSSSRNSTFRTWIIFAFTLVLVSLVVCDAESELFQRMTRRKFCGKHLTQTLALLCTSYNTMAKKSDEYQYPDQSQALDDEPIQIPGFPFLSRVSGTSMMPGTFRRFRRQGVYDECCKKSCTVAELKGYCSQ